MDNKWGFEAVLNKFSIDGDGEAKLTLDISKEEVSKMYEIGTQNGKRLGVAIVVIEKEY